MHSPLSVSKIQNFHLLCTPQILSKKTKATQETTKALECYLLILYHLYLMATTPNANETDAPNTSSANSFYTSSTETPILDPFANETLMKFNYFEDRFFKLTLNFLDKNNPCLNRLKNILNSMRAVISLNIASF